MVKTLTVALMVALLALVGCATQKDVDMMGEYYASKVNHDGQQTLQVTAKADRISKIMTVDCGYTADPYCIALSMIMKQQASEAIAEMTTEEFALENPTLSTDVQLVLIEGAAKIATGWIIVDGVKYALDRAGDRVGGDKANGDIVKGDGNTLDRTETIDESHATQVTTQNANRGDNHGAPVSNTNNPLAEPTVEEAVEGICGAGQVLRRSTGECIPEELDSSFIVE